MTSSRVTQAEFQDGSWFAPSVSPTSQNITTLLREPLTFTKWSRLAQRFYDWNIPRAKTSWTTLRVIGPEHISRMWAHAWPHPQVSFVQKSELAKIQRWAVERNSNLRQICVIGVSIRRSKVFRRLLMRPSVKDEQRWSFSSLFFSVWHLRRLTRQAKD